MGQWSAFSVHRIGCVGGKKQMAQEHGSHKTCQTEGQFQVFSVHLVNNNVIQENTLKVSNICHYAA